MMMESVEKILKEIERYNIKFAEDKHRQLIKCCSENDFIVPSVDIKNQIEKILPEGTKVVVSHYADGIYMVKRINYSDLIQVGENG